jgi:hypothetical protein
MVNWLPRLVRDRQEMVAGEGSAPLNPVCKTGVILFHQPAMLAHGHWALRKAGADGETCTPVGQCPVVYKTTAVAAEPRRRLNWWAATVLPRALRFKRPLHRCNACDPLLVRQPGVSPGRSVWKTDMLNSHHCRIRKMVVPRGNAPRSSSYQADALLLSYETKKWEGGVEPPQQVGVTCLRTRLPQSKGKLQRRRFRHRCIIVSPGMRRSTSSVLPFQCSTPRGANPADGLSHDRNDAPFRGHTRACSGA